METMFDTLLQLPLLQGLAKEDFTRILAKVKLSFVKYYPGDIIASSGNQSRQLIYVLRGKYTTSTTSPDGNFSFIEEWQVPTLLFPQSLFGMDTRFPATCVAVEETHVVCIAKSEMLNELFNYEIFRLNYMNILSNRAQTFQNKVELGAHLFLQRLDFCCVHSSGFCVVVSILSLSERPVGKKTLKINMEYLGNIINETRVSVSHSLKELQKEGLVELKRKEIIIPSLEEVRLYLFSDKQP